MFQEITPLENKFITHIRTLQLRFLYTHKENTDEYVFLSMREIRAYYFDFPLVNIEKLKELKLLDYKTVKTKAEHEITKYKTLQDGEIDFSLLKKDAYP